jgi:hypothetical protein
MNGFDFGDQWDDNRYSYGSDSCWERTKEVKFEFYQYIFKEFANKNKEIKKGSATIKQKFYVYSLYEKAYKKDGMEFSYKINFDEVGIKIEELKEKIKDNKQKNN